MCNSGIRNTCDTIYLYIVNIVTSCKQLTTAVPHTFHIDALIGRCRITVIYPQEGTDFHFILRLLQYFNALRCDEDDFSGSQITVVMVAQIQKRTAFKGCTETCFLFSKNDRCSSKQISCGINAILCHQQNAHTALDKTLYILQTFNNRRLVID